MRKILPFLLIFNLYSYTLDFPGDVPPLDANPNFKDPTLPSSLEYKDDILKILNEFDNEKLLKLKKALDLLFSDLKDEPNPISTQKKNYENKKSAKKQINVKFSGQNETIKRKENSKNNIKINIK